MGVTHSVYPDLNVPISPSFCSFPKNLKWWTGNERAEKNYHHGAWFFKSQIIAIIQIMPWSGHETLSLHRNELILLKTLHVKCLTITLKNKLLVLLNLPLLKLYSTNLEKRHRKMWRNLNKLYQNLYIQKNSNFFKRN